MIKGYYERIAAFLSDYVNFENGAELPPNVKFIKEAIELLINGGYFTKDGLRREALRSQDVIIREDLFPDDHQTERRI